MGKITAYSAITAVDPSDEFVVIEGGTGGTTKKATTSVDWTFNKIIANTGINLGGTASANLLDDYEEGSWTPVLWDSTLGTNAGTATVTGRYTKIGNRVFINCRIIMSALGSLITTDAAQIGGLPFPSSATANTHGSITVSYGNNLNIVAGTNITALSNANVYYITPKLWDAATGMSFLSISEITASGDLILGGHYITDL